MDKNGLDDSFSSFCPQADKKSNLRSFGTLEPKCIVSSSSKTAMGKANNGAHAVFRNGIGIEIPHSGSGSDGIAIEIFT